MHIPRRPSSPGCRPAPLALAVLLALGAQQALAQSPAGAGAPAPIRIAALPLAQALAELARQTGTTLVAAPALLADRTAPAVAGTLSAQQALDRLLDGSGLAGTFRDGVLTVQRAPQAGSGESALPAVTVTAGAGRAGELPEAYAGGQVASGSRLGLLGSKDFMETPFNTISYTDTYVQNVQADQLSRVIALTDPSVFSNGATGMLSDNFTLRGFGLSQSDVAYGGLYGLIPYYRVTPELAERIEVLKGPSALLNGMPPGGSVGGTVNLVPKHAGEEPLARLTATYASDAQFGIHADVGQRFGPDKQLGVRFNGVWRDGDSAVDHQSKTAKLAALGLDWRADRVRLSADLYASEDHTRGLNRGISLASGVAVPRPPRPETLLAPDWTFGTTKDQAVLLRGEVDVTHDLTAYAAYGHGRTDFDALASSTYTVLNAQGDYRNNFSHQRSIYDKDSAEAGVRARFHTGGVGHELALTATYYQHDNQFGFLRNMLARDWVTNLYDPAWGPSLDTSYSHAPLARTGALRTTSYGVADTLSFAQGRVQLTLGVRRQSVVSDTFDAGTGARTARYEASATTPAAALLVKATDRLSVYGNYIEGLSQGATAPATAANAGEVFPPYKTKQQEVGLKMDLGGFGATLSLFQITRPSALTDPVTTLYSFGGEQRNRGVELGFFGEPAHGLRLLGGIAYTQAKLTRTQGGANEGRDATAFPRWQGKLGVEWDMPAVQGLTLTGNAVSMSRQYINADNSLWVPGRTVFDLGARYALRVAARPVTLRATVQNVANKAYWAGSLASGTGAPRTFLLSASVDF
ncbi:TonB-dependent siderophore receptor [Pseudorhodoferax sp.]|uniref:TonB-dependent siderophore receptor n=1 Tax=Pseudorhodoferax sp. TaxID=1993553 RepID=UPI0039E44F3F